MGRRAERKNCLSNYCLIYNVSCSYKVQSCLMLIPCLDAAIAIPDSRFPIPNSRFPIPDSRFPIPDSRFLILNS
ncbi:hypothetical protein [Moorena sp. SIO3H5]|uniref:hypothetical protein n=1 Tax=Moorena sp. SIO3H5 TaxID=2607834 RepID=UPI0013BE7084|nr:hypothetical protein [Moorena sp. SIO3H5]NEO72171.1 hypothetical protein [Moorena sp. SIO3H5]